jgi:hypothetical protein
LPLAPPPVNEGCKLNQSEPVVACNLSTKDV